MNRETLLANLFENFIFVKRLLIKPDATEAKSKLPTRAQLGLLMMVEQNSTCTIKHIAELFYMSSSAITQLVDTLVTEGLLLRKEDTADRRKLSLVLTSNGRKKLELAKKERLLALTNVFEPLSNEELLQLQSIQQKIIDHFKTL